jgi:hypothetical protein
MDMFLVNLGTLSQKESRLPQTGDCKDGATKDNIIHVAKDGFGSLLILRLLVLLISQRKDTIRSL